MVNHTVELFREIAIGEISLSITSPFFQDEKLKHLVEIQGERWDFIANHFPDRTDVQCQHRWQKVVNPELVKGNSAAWLPTCD
jgi:hypothetical protein